MLLPRQVRTSLFYGVRFQGKSQVKKSEKHEIYVSYRDPDSLEQATTSCPPPPLIVSTSRPHTTSLRGVLAGGA
jgi:hypothetical protein